MVDREDHFAVAAASLKLILLLHLKMLLVIVKRVTIIWKILRYTLEKIFYKKLINYVIKHIFRGD